MLEPKGRSTWGWEQNAMLTVDPAAKQVTHNPEFYVMKHFAHFTAPGDLRIGLKGPWAGNAVAFEKPDGTRVLVLANPFADKRELRLSIGTLNYEFKLEPESFHTIVIPGH
ncbi:glycoside hydrolase family 30 beta sandwich domain-containing protein [Paenibacillus alkaliterrae]